MSKVNEYNDALKNYYYLKTKYEGKLSSKKSKTKKTKTDKERLCVKCNKKGGTTFSRLIEKSTNGSQHVSLIAKCNAETPCDLDINIKLAKYKLYHDLVTSINKQMEAIKTDIIKLKLDLLFQLKDEDYVVSSFEKLKSKLMSLSNKIDKLNKTYNEKNNTFLIKKVDDVTKEEYEEKINRKEAISVTTKEIEGVLSKYGKIMKEYHATKNKAFLVDAFEKYHKQVVDLFNKKRNIQYQSSYSYVNDEGSKRKEDDKEHFIYLKDVTIENKQVSLNQFEIIKNVY